MKKFKRTLSLLLTFALLMTTAAFTSVTAFGADLTQDFENVTIDELMSAGWGTYGTTNLTITTVGDTKALELDDGTGGVKIPLNAESGKVEISFFVRAEGNASNTDVKIPIELTNGSSSRAEVIYFAPTQIQETSGAADKIRVSRNNDVWYDVKVTVDDWAAETKTFTTNVYNHGETTSLGSYTSTYTFDNEYLLIRNWGATTTVSNPIYIDNVSVKEVVEVPEFENPVKINEDFEDDSTLEDAKADGLKDQANIDTYGKIVDDSGNKAMGLLRSTTSSSGFYYELAESITSGKVKLTFRVKTAQTNTLPVCVGDSSSITAKNLFQLVNDKTIVGQKKGEIGNSVIASSYPANEWINVDVLMDLDNDVASITIGDVEFDTDFTLGQVRYVTFRSWYKSGGDNTNYDLFDDIVVQKWVEVPELYDTDVKLYDLEGAVITSGVVTPAVSKITLDFGTELFEDSLTDAVTLTNTDANTTETLTASNITAQGVCTFETDVLEAKTKYILKVSTGVKNISGTAMAEEFEYEFTTGEGIKEVELTNVTKGSTAVSKLSDFTAGASIALNGTYLSFDEAETELAWVIAYFDGDILKKASVVETSVSGKGLKDITCPATVIADMTGIDKVEVYLWNNMEDIVPYCTGLSY